MSKRVYCPLGPIADSKEALAEALEDLKTEAKKRKLDFVRVEPTLPGLTADDLTGLKLIKSNRDVQPPHTVVNDVSVDEGQIAAHDSHAYDADIP